MQKQLAIAPWAVLVSLAMHVMLAFLLWGNTTQFRPRPGSLQDDQVMQVRFHAHQDTNEVTANPAAPGPLVNGAVTATDAGAEEDALNLHNQDTAQEAEKTATLVLPPKEAPYLPVGEVDVRPYPETPIVVPFPDGPLPEKKVSAVVLLYIGADGAVDRIEIDESDLPPVFEQVAKDTFLKARMRPAVKDGKATRVRMKILVEFEAR